MNDIVDLPAHKDYSTLVVDYVDGVVTVRLNRPDKLNAISMEMADQLREVVATHAYHPDARVMVVHGAGRAFCAGYDLNTGAAGDSRRAWLQNARFQSAFQAFAAAPVVRIARLNGHVVGAGMLLAAACELRYAAPDTTFYIPELDMGIPFSLGGVSLVVRYIGLTRAADMILNGTKMDAVTAVAAGLVTEVVADGELAARVDTIARRVAARPAALLLASLVSLGEAARDLVPADTVDLATMQFAADDPEAAAVAEAYARRFRH